MASNTDTWLKQAKEVIAERNQERAISFAVSMLTAVYGAKSSQATALREGMQQIAASATSSLGAHSTQQDMAVNAIKNTIKEIESGLIVDLRAQVAGEVMSELIALGKEILDDGTGSATNVSAVLIAASFEDLMRRMGSELAGVAGRPKLEDVIVALKNAGILNGSEVGIALSYLQFRNHSLHADWSKVEKS